MALFTSVSVTEDQSSVAGKGLPIRFQPSPDPPVATVVALSKEGVCVAFGVPSKLTIDGLLARKVPVVLLPEPTKPANPLPGDSNKAVDGLVAQFPVNASKEYRLLFVT